MKKVLITLIGIILLSGCTKVKQEIVTKYPVFERFGTLELDTNFLKDRGFNERDIINFDKKGKVLDRSHYKYQYQNGFVLQFKQIYKNDSVYVYNEYGRLETVFKPNTTVKLKSVKQGDLVYIINNQDTIFQFQLIKNTKKLIIRKVNDDIFENYLEFIERKYY